MLPCLYCCLMESWPETKKTVSKPVFSWTHVELRLLPRNFTLSTESQSPTLKKVLLDFFLLPGSGSSKSSALLFLIPANTIGWQEKRDLSSFQAILWISSGCFCCLYLEVHWNGLAWSTARQKWNSVTRCCMFGHIIKLSIFLRTTTHCQN